ncbi:uncharacterized protein LOC128202086 [Galleria mellonella]|uniref:Uncharacterized protein LOC128202086 n=1 Tax=Galleria mellonella TaxID=7137 RepID=A0ABM3N0E8_GALME|nr:uncharacterized protein LOC128202086 [Galleria mellonella]XP_052757072.1 uncharacterized protein LOC128202086 [Galleria mellonella]
MSDVEHVEHLDDTADNSQILSAEYKDGQLQIVEVTPFEKNDQHPDAQILPDLESDEVDPQSRYVQVINPDKSVMQLDLLNMTLVRCDDGSYKLVANAETTSDIPADSTVTCVLQSSDNEDPDNQDAYVMVNDEQGPLVFLQSTLPQTNRNQEQSVKPVKLEKKALSPAEILERAKKLQKAKALVSRPGRTRGRRRKSDLPPPHELLSSPNFKLFLYSCKVCSFKCNAIKEMTAHKAAEHAASGGGRWRGGRAPAALQCARCPYKAASHSQLMKHVQEKHVHQTLISEDKDENTMQVLVCGACGFESSSRNIFKKHLEDKHGAIAR